MWETVVFREVPRLLGQCESGALLARNWEENCAFEVPRVEGQSPGGNRPTSLLCLWPPAGARVLAAVLQGAGLPSAPDFGLPAPVHSS